MMLRMLLAVLLVPSVARTSVAADDKLAEIVGGDLTQWRVSRYMGTADDYTVRDEAGKPVLVAGPNATLLTSLAPMAADTEIAYRVRLGAAGGKATSVYLTAGLKTADDATQGPLFLNLNVPAGPEQEYVICAMPAMPGQPQGVYQHYLVRSLPKNRLMWPEMVRARVEEDVTSVPPLAKRWLTVRYVIRKRSVQIYLDDRLVRDAKFEGIEPAGHVRIWVFEGSQLAGIRVRKLAAEDPNFEPVALDSHVNAAEIKQDRVQRDSLPPAGAIAALGGVPFAIPAANDRGHDHVDVGRSWMRFGPQEGMFDGWEGEIPRWQGFTRIEPGRICFRVRNAPYSRLHLLAAFDGEPDKTPVVTAQFYRRSAGHPVEFSARAPLFTATSSDATAVPVRLASGKTANLYVVTIPLEPQGLASFADVEYLDFELTKETRIHRSFPDPVYYSRHGAGLPSGVHVYGMTLERPAVEVELQPDRFAHIWTAPAKPSYTVRLRNNTPQERELDLDIATVSHDGSDKTSQKQHVRLAAGAKQDVKLQLPVTRYGYHDVKLQSRDGQGLRTQTRSLAYLHPDTRERGNWEEGKGPIFGMWDWNGGHETPSGIPRLEMAVAAGIESTMRPLVPGQFTPEELEYAEKHGMMTHFLAYQLTPSSKEQLGVTFDASKPEEMGAAIVAALKKSPMATVSKTNKPDLAVFYGEPLLGPVSYMSLPEFYGDPAYKLTADEQKAYQRFHDEFVIAATAIKKEWPHAKCLFPWGISSFPIPFLRNSPQVTALMDGPAVDQILFERPPEMQLHQVTFSSTLWQLKQEWLKTGKPWPKLITVEGGGLSSPATPGGVTKQQEADHSIRGELLLAAFGVTRHLGWPTLFRCAGAWGETHYGGGMCDPLPLNTPKVFYVAFATLTRHLNRMNYAQMIETGSASAFCQQFKHYKSGELLHIFWTLRGTRPITLKVPAGTKLTVYDQMDNLVELTEQSGQVTLTATTSPCYVHGLTADAQISLGEPAHADSKPADVAQRLANIGDGTWKVSTEQDSAYETSHAEFVRRFPGKMTTQPVAAPAEQGGRALSVHLETPEKERKVMPFYTTLVPEKPVTIAGKPSHIGLWVKAASDWGRVVYFLRDANGERWISVGKKGEWNVDDPHCWSAFNFDGWRYLRHELPGNQPWDCYREAGTSFWGYYGGKDGEPGDGMIDLPLSLEKIVIERRTHVIKADELFPANPADVLLGDLYAEYEREADRTDEAVRLSRLRIPMPQAAPALENPIVALTETGTNAATTITSVKPPEREYDGTRCHVFFEPVSGAKSYDVWVSTYPDGRGAIRLGVGWTQSGQLLTGLPANVPLYLFVTYTGADDKASKPSAAKRILLKDDFPFK